MEKTCYIQVKFNVDGILKYQQIQCSIQFSHGHQHIIIIVIVNISNFAQAWRRKLNLKKKKNLFVISQN